MFKYFNPNIVGGPTDNTLPLDAFNMQHGYVCGVSSVTMICLCVYSFYCIQSRLSASFLQYPETDFATAKLNAAVSMARLQDIGPQIEYVAISLALQC